MIQIPGHPLLAEILIESLKPLIFMPCFSLLSQYVTRHYTSRLCYRAQSSMCSTCWKCTTPQHLVRLAITGVHVLNQHWPAHTSLHANFHDSTKIDWMKSVDSFSKFFWKLLSLSQACNDHMMFHIRTDTSVIVHATARGNLYLSRFVFCTSLSPFTLTRTQIHDFSVFMRRPKLGIIFSNIWWLEYTIQKIF